MGLFGNNNVDQNLSYGAILQKQYDTARHNLLLVVAFTLINLIMLITNSNSYFLFSAYIPYAIGDAGMFLCGKYPEEYYNDVLLDFQFMGDRVFAIFVAVAIVCIALYLLCWLFSKKQRVGWVIAALVLFVIDTIALIVIAGFSLELVLDYVFHVWVIVILAKGISAHYKLKNLPPEEPEENIQEEYTENL